MAVRLAALTAALVAVILTAGCVPLSREQRLILGVGLVNAPAPGAGEAQVTKVRVAGICVTGRQASVGLADIWTARVPATGQVVLAWDDLPARLDPAPGRRPGGRLKPLDAP